MALPSFLKPQEKKSHTIRAGNRFKAGDKFSPRFCRSPQIIFWHDIEVKRTWKLEVDINGVFSLDGKHTGTTAIARNDGFNNEEDFLNWFPLGKEFDGQIICWNDEIKY